MHAACKRAAADEHYRHHGGGGGGGWSGGVGVGVGAGTILLNEAIRRQQEKQQYKQHVTQPNKGCPEGMTWSRKKRTCIKVNVPEISKCEPPKIKTRKGCLYPQPETASCTWPEIKSGKGCACAGGYMRKHGECVKEVVSCDWPKIRVGPGCMCAPGFVPAGSGCTRVVIVDPGNQEPRHEAPPPQQVEEPQGPPPPPPPQRAEEPKPKPKPQAVAQVEAPIRCLPQDLYDLLTEAYGKRPGVGPCPTACLPKPAFFSPAKLDEVATKTGISWCENCLQVGPYMPLASINKLEALAHLTICVSPDSCVYPGGTPAEPRTEIRTVFKTCRPA